MSELPDSHFESYGYTLHSALTRRGVGIQYLLQNQSRVVYK